MGKGQFEWYRGFVNSSQIQETVSGTFFMFYDIKTLREDQFFVPSLYLHESVSFPFADGKAVAEKKQEAFRRKK